MTQQDKIELLAEMFEVEAEAIHADTALDTLAWDSMAMLSLIALVNEHCNKKLTGEQLRGFTSIQDILDVME